MRVIADTHQHILYIRYGEKRPPSFEVLGDVALLGFPKEPKAAGIKQLKRMPPAAKGDVSVVPLLPAEQVTESTLEAARQYFAIATYRRQLEERIEAAKARILSLLARHDLLLCTPDNLAQVLLERGFRCYVAKPVQRVWQRAITIIPRRGYTRKEHSRSGYVHVMAIPFIRGRVLSIAFRRKGYELSADAKGMHIGVSLYAKGVDALIQAIEELQQVKKQAEEARRPLEAARATQGRDFGIIIPREGVVVVREVPPTIVSESEVPPSFTWEIV